MTSDRPGPRTDSHEIDARQRQVIIDARQQETSSGLFGALEVAAAEGRARLAELLALSPDQYKSSENRLRRMANRQGLQLQKSRRRDRTAADYRKYMLVDANTTDVPTGGNWSLDLADVEAILLGASGPAMRRVNAGDCPVCGIPTYSLSGLVQGARVDERECPDCGYSFIARPEPEHQTPNVRTGA